MPLSREGEELRDHFVGVLLDAARQLQRGPDRELALEALVEAAGLLRDQLGRELAALRVEEAD